MKISTLRLKQIIKEEVEIRRAIYFQVYKIPGSNEYRIATNRRERRLGGYTVDALPEGSEWLTAIEKLTDFPEGEWRDVHYAPSTEEVKHYSRGLPYIPSKQQE